MHHPPALPINPHPCAKTTHNALYPLTGTAFIGGRDITRDMSYIYSIMGVCPQHDLLWDTLTGREHLLFYGRLKGLTGEVLFFVYCVSEKIWVTESMEKE